MGKIVLRVLWLEKTIGIALDESTGNSSYPMTEYFFWRQADYFAEHLLGDKTSRSATEIEEMTKEMEQSNKAATGGRRN